MIGLCIADDSTFERWAKPGIELIEEVGTKVIKLEGQPSIYVGYNRILAAARLEPDLEGVILIHEDLYIRQPDCLDILRRAFADPLVGVVGVYGVADPPSLTWHTQPHTRGRVEDRRFLLDKSVGVSEVSVLDGLFLALSPAAVSAVEFDETTFDGWHGYDADICLQARANGLRVETHTIDVYHATKGVFGSRASFIRTDVRFRAKWKNSGLLAPNARTWDTTPLAMQVALAVAPAQARVLNLRRQVARLRRRNRLEADRPAVGGA